MDATARVTAGGWVSDAFRAYSLDEGIRQWAFELVEHHLERIGELDEEELFGFMVGLVVIGVCAGCELERERQRRRERKR